MFAESKKVRLKRQADTISELLAQNEDLQDRVRRREDEIVEDLLTIDTLQKQLLEEQYQSVELELQRKNAFAAYDEKLGECTALRNNLNEAIKKGEGLEFGDRELQGWYDRVSKELTEANETIDKQAIEIDALQRMLQQYQLGKVNVERGGKAKPKGVLK